MRSLTRHLTAAVGAVRGRRGLAVIAAVVGLLVAPAGASAHGFYHWGEPGATAPDGHYIASISWEMPTGPDGWGTGQLIGGFRCGWSDGTIDGCEGVADYF